MNIWDRWRVELKPPRWLVVTWIILWTLGRGLIWLTRHPRILTPLVLGIAFAAYFDKLTTGLIVLAVAQAALIVHWAYRLLGKSQIDTWPELIHDLPKLWKLHRQWPKLTDATIRNIVVTPSGLQFKTTTRTQNIANLKKDELDLAAKLKALRVLIIPTKPWEAKGIIIFRNGDTPDPDIAKWDLQQATADEKYIVYGLTNETKDIIYVGITAVHRGTADHLNTAYTEEELEYRAALHRMKEHKNNQPWADEIDGVLVLHSHPNEKLARAEELDLIHRNPQLYNKMGNKRLNPLGVTNHE